MPYASQQIDNALIAIYGDSPDGSIAKSITSYISDRDVRILTPGDVEGLEKAAQNSSLVIVGLKEKNDENLKLGQLLKDNRMIVADIVGFCLDDIGLSRMEIMGKGFHSGVTVKDTDTPGYRSYLLQKIITGNRRLKSLIQEEEYRRICDALSCAPASMMIFDADKRIVFASDHYYRAYPKIAPMLTRGLSVYDVFALMMEQEGIPKDDERYNRLQSFWHSLSGNIEFGLDNGVVYRLKAVKLPSMRGTVIMGQNISGYHERQNQLEEASENLQQTIKTVVSEFEEPLGTLTSEIKKLKKPSESKDALKASEKALKELNALYKQAKRLSRPLDG